MRIGESIVSERRNNRWIRHTGLEVPRDKDCSSPRGKTLDSVSSLTHSPRPQGSPYLIPLDFIPYLTVLACSPLSTMSRRESRVSMSERQNDALFEFENCMCLPCFLTTHVPPHPPSHFTVKKKFLLANKHITKSVHAALRALSFSDRPVRLNSTLSVRIEELNAQISALHSENLRLRTSEIALGSQLKKEKEKSQRIITEAESAVSIHFHLLASSYCSRKPCPTISHLVHLYAPYLALLPVILSPILNHQSGVELSPYRRTIFLRYAHLFCLYTKCAIWDIFWLECVAVDLCSIGAFHQSSHGTSAVTVLHIYRAQCHSFLLLRFYSFCGRLFYLITSQTWDLRLF